jgi:predicted nucleotidyltransferase
MASYIQILSENKIISPPKFLPNAMAYETQMGSIAYGVSNDSSDMDIYGFCIPPKEIVFPHLAGEILGFGTPKVRFEQYQEHHIKNRGNNKTYDFSIYNIVKYFHLLMQNNPNMIDSVFTPNRCVNYITNIGKIVRENRKLFLHKGSWHKFKGYAYSQLSKIKYQKNKSNLQRAESIEKFGYDTKFAYHLVRLIDEAKQIMVEHDIDLEQNKEQLKSVRRGEWTLDYLQEWFKEQEKRLDQYYLESKLQLYPDENIIKKLLLNCLEEFYGSI